MKDIKHIICRVGLDSTMGVEGSFFFLPKFNQSWCVSYLHEWHMQLHNFLGPRPPGALGRGQKDKYH